MRAHQPDPTGDAGRSPADDPPAATAPGEVREWISFEDATEARTWVFDATFLRSAYRCIFGAGCQGVLDAPTPEMEQGCCSYGAHFVDDDDVATVVRAFVRMRPEQMQFHAEAVEAGFLAPGDDADDGTPVTTTRLVDDACIFLNRPGFERGAGCALHVAALDAGERPMDWKPNVCWQVPIRLEHSTDDNGHVTSRLRDWKRRDWGEGGAEFAWWCTEDPGAYTGAEPVFRSAADEIIGLVGDDVYQRLVELLETTAVGRGVAVAPPSRRRRS